MKKIWIISLLLMMTISLSACSIANNNNGMTNSANSVQHEQPSGIANAQPKAENTGNDAVEPKKIGLSGKVLVAYFSRSGNTREIANQIQQSVGGDIFEIVTVNSYPSDYDATTQQAKQELEAGFRPELKTRVENMKSYDTIFIGYPNWWATIPMPVAAFLSQYDLTGKTVIPFCTHEGSGLGRSVEDIRKLSPQSAILEGLAIRGKDVKSAQNEVAFWLRGLSTP